MQPIQPAPISPGDLGALGDVAPAAPASSQPSDRSFGAELAGPQGSTGVDGPGESATADWLKAPEAMDSLMQFIETRGSDLEMHELIAVQMRVHEISFQVETASKAIEHGMQGAKSLLQTQA